MKVFTKFLKEPVPNSNLYIAQMPLDDFPDALQRQVPRPDLILSCYGKVKHEGSSLWMGRPPTMTPLHRDPSANMFVQLAGKKLVRLFPPDVGEKIFQTVKSRIGTGGDMSGRLRGKEMMLGREKEELEKEVWGRYNSEFGGVQASLDRGSGLFIPQGWWHSVKGVGNSGVNASVNWWFRFTPKNTPGDNSSKNAVAGPDTAQTQPELYFKGWEEVQNRAWRQDYLSKRANSLKIRARNIPLQVRNL
ncbi:uncharacterized protein K452DRAFT_220398 [Aplosporella prunicola CBS 121167]|uniref:JmjC domain-containing protein n=1 Tax=Aplosporella prunicola CBS 121167 TaxID=1176127 RepID=A0A6A6BSZ0_9PEZI|nr:uncharacterized protein K452DRAFT_220398 [Aplosporella prunicola CBS 121167]KAF2145721.1 hypothetical protein K452DRAFT_220398 [Aplosporella prunicola CBS 121167]